MSRRVAYNSGLMPSSLFLVWGLLFRRYVEDRRLYVLVERSIRGLHLKFSIGISRKLDDGRHYV